jgi:hypothetical protein
VDAPALGLDAVGDGLQAMCHNKNQEKDRNASQQHSLAAVAKVDAPPLGLDIVCDGLGNVPKQTARYRHKEQQQQEEEEANFSIPATHLQP